MSRGGSMVLGALVALVALITVVLPAPASAAVPHHQLTIRLDAESSRLEVTDLIRFEAGEIRLLELAEHLEVLSSRPALEQVAGAREVGEGALPVRTFRVPEDVGQVELRYAGRYDFGLGDPKEEYARGFRQTPGLISADGVYLAASSAWIATPPVPGSEAPLVSFAMTVELPAGWHVISQGHGTSRDAEGRASWTSQVPMEEIFLVGGPLLRYADRAGDIETLVYLRRDEAKLARTYLETTAQYLEMYRRLIGDYPYGKFALVENFWETGYGMPSFTLLGPRVIRFPFILHSSYPHEILHNYWGNGVWVDWQSGNWSEGLTAYLADHLVQEQRGRGAEYRHDTLKRYRNYVQEAEDFPLRDFRSRHDAVTEAVGYGKTLIGFHMLRRQLGDRAFSRALATFWQQQRGHRAGFSDWRQTLEEASSQDLGAFFEAWVEHAGAPALEVRAEVRADGDGWVVAGTLRNTGTVWPLAVPLEAAGAGGEGAAETVSLDGREAAFELRLDTPPARLDVDPDFDLFRLLDARETAASLGTLFGAPEVVAVVAEGYESLAGAWTSDSHHVHALAPDELDELPPGRSLWIFGRDNPWAGRLGFKDDRRVAGEELPPGEGSFLEVRRHPGDPGLAVAWLWTEVPAAIPGLIRKLPHYGKYAELGFTGDEPQNVAKARGAASDSPLVVDLRPRDRRRDPLPTRAPQPRSALAELPPAFSATALQATVERLADPSWHGRGLGTEGLDLAAEWLAERFRELGLEPAGDDGGFLQWLETEGPDGKLRTANVVGRRPGSDPGKPAVVLGAHYDHLGMGFPDVHAGDAGKIHPGADDNASGVAVLLELARALEGPALRDLYVVAFTAEEAGRHGSKHFVDRLGGRQLHSMVNLDTVGRAGDRPIDVLSSGSADEWPHVVRGVGFVTGIEGRSVPGVDDASDQKSFLDAGVPAVQLFTGAHADYHRPSDTADKVGGEGLVRVAVFTREIVAYLLDRPEPLTGRLGAVRGQESAPAPPASGRRARLGTIPDFAFAGPGVRIESISPQSPASRAGLEAGDILLELAGRPVKGLRGYSALLRELGPGDRVKLKVRRGEKLVEIEAVLEAR